MGYASYPPSYKTEALPIHLLHGMLNVVFHLSRILILLARLYFEFSFYNDISPKNVYNGQYRSRTYDLRVISTTLYPNELIGLKYRLS